MPYGKLSELPDYVRKLPEKKQRQWKHVFNGCHASGKPESKCFAMANGVVKSTATEEELGEFEGALTKWASEGHSIDTVDAAELNLAQKSWQYVDTWEYEQRKLSQEDAEYNPAGGNNERACSNCFYFVSPARCTVVRGEIAPNGVSNQWKAVPPPKIDPMPVVIVGGGSLKATVQSAQEVRDNLFKRVVKTLFGVTPGAAPTPGVTDGANGTYAEGIRIFKQADGQLRWVARYSNAWEDRDKEILTEEAHKEFIEWAYSTKNFPELWLWHTPGTRIGEADWLDFSDGFAHASGTIEKGKEAVVEFLAKQEVGVSHGFFGKQEGKYVTKYRSFEISALPLNRAAVWTTDFNVIEKETTTMSFSAERKKWLTEALGAEAVAELEKNTGALATQLKELGLEYKSTDGTSATDAASTAAAKTTEPAAAAAAPAANAAPAAAAAATVPAEGEKATSISKEVSGMLVEFSGALQQVVGAVAAIQKDVAEMKKSDDDKVADLFTAKAAAVLGHRPTEDDKNVSGEKETGPKDFLGEIVLKQLGGVGAAVEGANAGAGTPAVGAVSIK